MFICLQRSWYENNEEGIRWVLFKFEISAHLIGRHSLPHLAEFSTKNKAWKGDEWKPENQYRQHDEPIYEMEVNGSEIDVSVKQTNRRKQLNMYDYSSLAGEVEVELKSK
jgi:hypothetical protein